MKRSIGLGVVLGVIFAVLIVLPASASPAAPSSEQKTFVSPEEAVKTFIGAIRRDDKAELSAIFGPGSSELSTGDEVSDRADRRRFLKAYEKKNSIEKENADKAVLQVGIDDWPFPVPIVKKGAVWFFDTAAGKEEILNRRIGRDELSVIEVMHGYVGAQREYASKDRDGDGVYPYAQKLMSSPGKKDGLYWEAKNGEEQSPAGPFMARAAGEGYHAAAEGNPSPFHGYYFRILTAQGSHAPGGAYDYVVKGNMILGFGLIAWPARYGSSGIMTFLVNQQGVVYQKDLGGNTDKEVQEIREYDPDETWKKVGQRTGLSAPDVSPGPARVRMADAQGAFGK